MSEARECIGLIGAGVMGQAIGGRLLDCGHDLRVYDRNPPKVAALESRGATGAANPADAARGAGFVITSLNSADAVEAVIFGNAGIRTTAAAGLMIIDMSSIDPVATRALATRAAAAGLRWLDCPLSGGAPKAATGTLTVMAGGEDADFDVGRRVMDDLCANFTLMGPAGAGQTTKLINQVLCALNFVAVAEATRLALDAGVAAARIPAALKGGRADSAILQEFMAKMAAGDMTPTGRLDNMVKDLNAVQALAQSTGTALPMTSLCAEIHRLLTQRGLGPADNAALMRFWPGETEGLDGSDENGGA